MPFRAYPAAMADRFDELSELYLAGRVAFRETVDETEWRPTPRSAAAGDEDDLSNRNPPLPEGAAYRVSGVLYCYLFAASEHLGALAALYRLYEVLIPPPTLVRSVVEHCGVAAWVLNRGEGPVDDRLARAYLEGLLSAEEAKKAAGRLFGKGHDQHASHAAHFKALRAEAERVFGEKPIDDGGIATIRGQQRPSPTEAVASMLRTMGQPLAQETAVATYDYLSNLSHPTLYPHSQMWSVSGTGGKREVGSAITLEDHEKLVRIALVPYYEMMARLTRYNGWSSGPHDRLTAAMDRLLPGVFTASAKL